MRVSLGALAAIVLLSASCRDEPSQKGSEISRTYSNEQHVFVKGAGKWHSLEDLETKAKQIVSEKSPKVSWNELQEINHWVDPLDPTNMVKIHFSFGLGNRSFLIFVDKQGAIARIHDGKEVESVVSPTPSW